jgi:helicase
MQDMKPGFLRYLSVLINNELAPGVLRILRDSQQTSNKGVRSVDIAKKLGKSRGHVSETISRLQMASMVDNKEFLGITAEGLKAVQVYDSLENDTELENQPATVKELLRRHRYPFLLPAQREFLRNHFPLSKSMIIMASPSAGKTFLAECCVLDELQKGGRILYITPFKALNRQKYDLFARYFSEYRIVRTDGDTFPSFETLGRANLVVATYEKALLAMLRNEPWLRNFSLTVADEITVLGDDERGPSLDLLLSMLKDKTRLLTLSSHLHNTPAIEDWLDAESFEWPPDELGDEYIVAKQRSNIVIETRFGSQTREFQTASVFEAIVQHSGLAADSTMIVLVGERRTAEEVALEVSKLFPPRADIPDVLALADEQTPLLGRLRETLDRGVVFHHAGLPFDVRESLEDLLNRRKINIVVCTPTLSYGVDFPLDHVAVDWDSFGRKEEKKIEYLQYRGRAARIGRSRDGNVYVFSRHENGAAVDIREFLAKPVEDVFPPYLDRDHFEWIVMLSCHSSKRKTVRAIVEHARVLLKNLLTLRNPQFEIDEHKLTRTLEKALSNLQRMGMLSIRRSRVTDTKWGKQISRIDWVPRDSYFAITSLKKIPRRATEETITRSLLSTVCYLGLMKRLDLTRTHDIELAYLEKSTKEGKLPRKEDLQGLAVSSVLRQWMEEKPIEEIIRDSTTGSNIVHDEDIRKFGSYASVEMRKLAMLAEELRNAKVAKVANKLVPRLKRGIRQSLVSDDPVTDLSRLDGIARRRQRLLYDSGFKTLLDICKLIFHEGEPAFIEKSKLPEGLAHQMSEQLRLLVQSDADLAERCKKL